MNTSEKPEEVYKALFECQENLRNPAASAENPHFQSRYATLPSILNALRPVLREHGLMVMQNTFSGENGAQGCAAIVTRLVHQSGEWVETNPLILKGHKQDAQGTGSAITYGRRYQLLSLLGLAGEDEDDDGNEAAKGGRKPSRRDLYVQLRDSLEVVPREVFDDALTKWAGVKSPKQINRNAVQDAIDNIGEFEALCHKVADGEDA